MERATARRMWRSCEPYHGMVYFVPEARAAYEAIGLDGRSMGYVASRSAAMGAVGPGVVTAAFFNFHPDLVAGALPAAWRRASPETVARARLDAVDAALRRILGDAVDSTDMAQAAALAAQAAAAGRPEGRPLFAAHASLPWPAAPHLALWHALTLLRELRGDGHVAALLAEGLTGCEALVLHGASGEVDASLLQASRGWTDDEWAAAHGSLRRRRWLTADGELSDAGRAGRQRVEDLTDDLALGPWRRLGQERSDRLRELVRPWSRAVVDAGTFSAASLVGEGG